MTILSEHLSGSLNNFDFFGPVCKVPPLRGKVWDPEGSSSIPATQILYFNGLREERVTSL